MQIKASTALRNEYLKISELAHASGEPVISPIKARRIWSFSVLKPTRNGRKMLAHRVSILEAELSRLNGEPTYTAEQVDAMLKEKFRNVEHAT